MTCITGIIVLAVLFCAWSGVPCEACIPKIPADAIASKHHSPKQDLRQVPSKETRAQDSDDGSCEGFGYREEQEEKWGECWPACNGKNQSPIDIEPKDAVIEDFPYLDGPFYQDRYQPFYFNLTNDNYTVTLHLLNADHLYLEGGPLDGRYFLEHLQFCWGSRSSMGSDHTYNEESYNMESQWGLFSEKYASYEEASQHPGGVLRISQLYPLADDENLSLAPIVRALPHVLEPGQSTTSDEELTYDQLFSGFPVDDYFYYNGSFTTPPCTETVMWFVYPPMKGVTEEQMAAFRKLQSTDGPLVNNFRQPKPLNGRKVVRSSKSTSYLADCETGAKPARRLSGKRHPASKSGKRHQATKSGRRHQATKSGQHGSAKHQAAARHH